VDSYRQLLPFEFVTGHDYGLIHQDKIAGTEERYGARNGEVQGELHFKFQGRHLSDARRDEHCSRKKLPGYQLE